jgi:hypothetical protein
LYRFWLGRYLRRKIWSTCSVRPAGGARPAGLGLSDEEVQQALTESHFLRNRFTICKLGRILGLPNGS